MMARKATGPRAEAVAAEDTFVPPPDGDNPLLDALTRLIEREVPGPLSVHMNLVLDEDTDAVIDALVADQDRNLNNRSKALRFLINRGAKSLLAVERRRA